MHMRIISYSIWWVNSNTHFPVCIPNMDKAIMVCIIPAFGILSIISCHIRYIIGIKFFCYITYISITLDIESDCLCFSKQFHFLWKKSTLFKAMVSLPKILPSFLGLYYKNLPFTMILIVDFLHFRHHVHVSYTNLTLPTILRV